MPDVLLLLFTGLIGLVLSYLVVTVFNVGGKPDEALNRDLEAMLMQISIQITNIIFLPLNGFWAIGTDLTSAVTGRAKWIVAFGLFTAATFLMHYYHYEVLSIIDDGWTCAIVPIMRNIITPLLQIQRVLFAILTPVVNAFIIIQAQIIKGWLSTFAQCSHINLFEILTEFSMSIITGTRSIANFFGYGSADDGNFYTNDFNIDQPVKHALAAVSVSQKVLACACNRFEPLFNIAFFVTMEPHVVAAIDNGFQVLVRAAQMVFNLLFKKFPDIYKVSFKLERALNEGGLAMDSIMFNVMENFIKMGSPDFSMVKKPEEGPFTMATQTASAAVHAAATVAINGPLHVLASFDPEMTAFKPEIWSLDRSFSYLNRAVYNGAVLLQWLVYVMERLVTDTSNIGAVFTDKNTPLELNCDWARDVEDHKYVSISYTAGCSLYNMGIIPLNTAHIAYGTVVELLTKSIFTQEQNIFRTLQRWEGPTIARNKVYTCEDRKQLTAYDYVAGKSYNKEGGWLWTQDRGKCNCELNYGFTLGEKEGFYNPWCGQPNLNFDVFAPMDALVMHVSHGVLGPGFGDAFPFIDPIQNIEIDLQVGSKSIQKSIALPFPLPPLTRTAIESLRVMTRVVLSFGDIVTGHFFNYPVNCGHGLNATQLATKWEIEQCTKWKDNIVGGKCDEYSWPGDPGKLTNEIKRWYACDKKKYKPLKKPGSRTELCKKNNNEGGGMCSYLQDLTPDSKCLCISRYPDLDVTASSQQVGDLIEKRFTSEDVAHHWCNSMIVEWTFQNTAAFADALDYMVSLGPINPTCDVMDRLIENKALGVDELDQRSKSAYLIENTPTLEFTGQFMDSSTKLNHIKDLYSDTRAGCKIKPGEWITAKDERGNIIYEKDADGQYTDKPVQIMSDMSWSCDASNSLKSVSEILKLTKDKDEEKAGCRIWGRDDFFCSAGLFVRNSKRLSMNVARQVINDGLAIVAGNYADVNLRTLPRLCDYERQQGAIAAMIAGIIPKVSQEVKQVFARYINMILQQVFVQPLRIMLTFSQMSTEIVTKLFSGGGVKASDMKLIFKEGVDTIINSYLLAFRSFFKNTGDLLNAISSGSGDICDTIIDIIKMLEQALTDGVMRIVNLTLDAIFNFIAALNGDAGAIGPFFTAVFSLWVEIQTLLLKKMWEILGKIFDFFRPVGTFFKVLLWGVCNALNFVMAALNVAIRTISLGTIGLDWDPMECVKPLRSGIHGNHTAGPLGKHFLREHDNKHITRRVAEALDWDGNSVCDHFMMGSAEYAYTDLRPLEQAKWFECLEFKLIGVEIAKFLQSPTFPTDVVYNWKRKYLLAFDLFRAIKVITETYVQNAKMDWVQARFLLIDEGLDADLYIRLTQYVLSFAGQILSSVQMTNVLDFVFEAIDPEYKKEGNPGAIATAWQTISAAKNIYQDSTNLWIQRDASQQWWKAVDASYEAHGHLQHWWSSIGKDIPAKQTHTERVFNNFKQHLGSKWNKIPSFTRLHSKIHKELKMPLNTDIQSCAERGKPGWCTDCNVFDNIIQTTVEQGQAIGTFYSTRFPKILNNVTEYFNQLGEYNSEFFEGTFSRLEEQTPDKPTVPKTSIRWTYHVKNDWVNLFSDFGEYMTNSSHKDIWLGQIDRFLGASRQFITSENDNYVPFFGYSFFHMYDYILFSKCDMDESIYVTTTTEEERLDRIDTALIVCALVILFIITNTTWSIIPLVWLANTIVIAAIVEFLYLWIVYGYFINCVPIIPYTLMEDFNAWYHTRLEPGCFYKALPFIAVNASEDTCLTCAIRQEYTNCAEYTIANYEDGMLPLSEFMDEYGIAWPFLFWVRWKWPSVAIFLVRNGIIEFESVIGRLAMGAWQQAPVDPIWIDCYNAMWLDNIVTGAAAALAGYIAVKMMFILAQTAIQIGILVMYIYTTLTYMSLAVEKSVVVN